MAQHKETAARSEGSLEKFSRLGRNITILGVLAIGGAALLLPGPSVVLGSWAALNAAQAAGFEWARRHSKNKRLRKN